MSAHWASIYIGTEWARDANCWHFCARVWSERFGVTVPMIQVDGADPRATRRALDASPTRRGWFEVVIPIEGDGVMMAKGAMPCHVGIWLELGGVLHCIEGAGAIFTPAERLADLGYRITGTYRRAAA